jgi:hypothetical protein
MGITLAEKLKQSLQHIWEFELETTVHFIKHEFYWNGDKHASDVTKPNPAHISKKWDIWHIHSETGRHSLFERLPEAQHIEKLEFASARHNSECKLVCYWQQWTEEKHQGSGIQWHTFRIVVVVEWCNHFGKQLAVVDIEKWEQSNWWHTGWSRHQRLLQRLEQRLGEEQ